MVWLWVAIAVIGVGLPAAAWRLGRNPRLRPFGVPGPHADPISRWLFDQYRLGELDRSRVRQAVLVQGRRPDQPALREPAHSLAAEVVSGRLGASRLRWWIWLYPALGVAMFANGVAEVVRGGGTGPFGIVEGAVIAIVGTAMGLWLPKQIRRKARRALEDGEVPGANG
jgi:hypothetical protein